MKSMRVEMILLVVVLLVGVAANVAPAAYADKGASPGFVPYPVIYPRSVGAYDGWVREYTETSNIGYIADSTATTIILGDDIGNRQYRSILHFNVSIPSTAVIVNAVIRIKKNSIAGTNPFAGSLGRLVVDLKRPYFGTTPGLVPSDFQVSASYLTAGVFSPTPLAGGWYKAVLNNAAKAWINRVGSTQFRLRFSIDDNNNAIADNMRFLSGNYATASYRPMLEIKYYVP